MTSPRLEESAAERFLATAMLVVFWIAFTCLGAGLSLWLSGGAVAGHTLMTIGLCGLLAMPMLRLIASLASAARTRDWPTMAATAAVLAILILLTLRDAARH
jgi:hypothetical protein